MKYPKAGALQKKLTTHLSANPASKRLTEMEAYKQLQELLADPDPASLDVARDLILEYELSLELDPEILHGMEQAIWLTSYADYVEELTPDEREAIDAPVNLSGIHWEDVAPSSPPSAMAAAEGLWLAYDRENGKSVGLLFLVALAADKKKPSEELADMFGYYLVMMAMGHGVSWFDDHAKFPIKRPYFEAHYYADDAGTGAIEWSPQLKGRENGRKKKKR